MRTVLIVVLVVSLAAAAFFGVRWQQAERAATATQAALDVAKQTADSLRAGASQEATGSGRVLLGESELRDLAASGITPQALLDSLGAHPELIPFKGVLGGTMGFYHRQEHVLLPSPYVFAYFEDGHIGGRMLLSYDVDPGPRIRWKRLWATLD